MKKKIIALLLMMVMILSMSACGTKNGKNSIGDVLTKAQENSNNAKSMDVTGTMKITMSADGETLDMTTDMNMAIFTDPYKAKISMTLGMGVLGTQSTEMYLIPDEDKYYTYIQANNEWYKQEMNKSAFESSVSGYNSTVYTDILTECEKDFTMSEVEEDGKSLYKLEGKLTGESMKKLIEATGALDQLKDSGLDTSVASVYENAGDLKIVVYIQKDTYEFYKISMDMKEMMEGIMNNTSTDASKTVTIDNCTMDMEYTNINSATEFELPEEAKDAPDVSGLKVGA